MEKTGQENDILQEENKVVLLVSLDLLEQGINGTEELGCWEIERFKEKSGKSSRKK